MTSRAYRINTNVGTAAQPSNYTVPRWCPSAQITHGLPFQFEKSRQHIMQCPTRPPCTISEVDTFQSHPIFPDMYVPAQFYQLASSAASPGMELRNTDSGNCFVYGLLLFVVIFILVLLWCSREDGETSVSRGVTEDLSSWDITLTADGELRPNYGCKCVEGNEHLIFSLYSFHVQNSHTEHD